jgi:uncharacterized protein YhbP (UPF0306 family)
MTTSSSSGISFAGLASGADDLRPRVLAYLRRHHTVSLATCGPEGPWAAAVFYVNRGFDLYFRSKTSSRHIRHLAANPRVAATISQDPGDWRAIQGVQMEGTAACVTEADEHMQVMLAFFQRYPFVEALWGEEEGNETEVGARKVYRVHPERVVFHDHERSAEPSVLIGSALQLG